MSEYKHGAYAQIQAAGSRVSTEAANAFVYVGTAPVNQVAGGGKNVNRPVLVRSIAEARRIFGYSDDWASFTLCEAMKVHLEQRGVGPLVLINVLDPSTHVKSTESTKTLTPSNGQVVIAGAEKIVLDTVTVKAGDTKKALGEDYTLAYNIDKQTLTIANAKADGLGTAALTITYKEVDPSAVQAADVIGSSDGYGLNKGLAAIRNVYQETGYIPSFLLAPGFSGVPAVHAAMAAASRKVGGHWDAYMLVDIPITDSTTSLTLATAPGWKTENGYTCENESCYFPLALGTDGRKYHLSVLAAANLQTLIAAQDGVPYRTASNTECGIIQNLYLGESAKGRVYDDALINDTLNKNGISSAAFVGGRWCIWGAHSADYGPDNADTINVSEVNRTMLYYISNDFQHRRSKDVDKPMTANDIQSIMAEEQARLDALRNLGAILLGEVHLHAEQDDRSDLIKGDFSFAFDVTVTPLAKSLTAVVNWTDEGFETYFAGFASVQ